MSEAALTALALEGAGIDLLEISGGNYETGIYADGLKPGLAKAKPDPSVRASTLVREA